MSEFLLELFSEELPSKMQIDAVHSYEKIFKKFLQDNNISYDTLEIFSSPRRIAVFIDGLSLEMEQVEEEIKGPKIESPEKTISGFCTGHGIKLEDLNIKESKGKPYYVYNKVIPARKTSDVIKDSINRLITSHTWSKSMRWGDYDLKWARPLHNIMCIFDGVIIPFEFGHLTANNKSFGHRFLSNESFTINSFNNYKQSLKESRVIISQDERKQSIKLQLEEFSSKYSLKLRKDTDLLDEVTGLVDYPTVFAGKFSESFLSLPDEVLISAMRVHQKYFCLLNDDNSLANIFLFVTNGTRDHEDNIISGNEKVLDARLRDALYFYEKDKKTTLSVLAQKLEHVILHERLGNMEEKSKRIGQFLYDTPPHYDVSKANMTALQGQGEMPHYDLLEKEDAARLCKADLVSEMVGEFANLQGIMGGYYALDENMSSEVADAIKNHYKPIGPQDDCPKGLGGYLALADKIDNLCGLMLAGEKPTSSKDPYALRRNALGIIRIIIENTLNIDIVKLLENSIKNFDIKNAKSDLNEIIDFIQERMKHYFKGIYDHRHIDAIVDLTHLPNIYLIEQKLKEFSELFDRPVGNELVALYKRASNILGDKKHSTVINENLLTKQEEKSLYNMINLVEAELKDNIEYDNFHEAIGHLSSLQQHLARFFDNVMVMDPDIKIASNRKALLQRIKDCFLIIANFDEL